MRGQRNSDIQQGGAPQSIRKSHRKVDTLTSIASSSGDQECVDPQVRTVPAPFSESQQRPDSHLSDALQADHKPFDFQLEDVRPQKRKAQKKRDPHALRGLSRGDQVPCDTQTDHVAPNFGGGQIALGNHKKSAPSGREVHLTDVTHSNPDFPTIPAIVELWKRRQNWHRAEKSLTLQMQAACRRLSGGDKEKGQALFKTVEKGTCTTDAVFACMPLMKARNSIEPERRAVEKHGQTLVVDLPGYAYCMNTPGLSAFTLFALIGECPGRNYRGFLDFETYERVWKRFGVAVIKEEKQGKKVGAEGILHGFNPSRRAVLFTIGAALMKTAGPYRDLYLKYKQEEQEKVEARGLKILPTASITKKNAETSFPLGQIHSRAQRKMEKQLLVDIWKLWWKDQKQTPLQKLLEEKWAA